MSLPPEVRVLVDDNLRLSVVETFASDHAADKDFDALTSLAAATLHAPMALVSVVDHDDQRFRSHFGFQEKSTPTDISFCAHAIAKPGEVMVVPNAEADDRFADNPLVTGPLHIRFYAGAPIVVAGQPIGTLCILDNVSRPWPEPEKLEQLRQMAELAGSLFTLKEGTRAGALAREALVREEKRRVIAMEAAGLSSWAWKLDTNTVECDDSLPLLFGRPSGNAMTPMEIFQAIDRRDMKDVEERFRESVLLNDDYAGEYRVRGFHPPRWLGARGRVVERNPQGQAITVFGVNYDITERKVAEERQRLFLRELNHRVKNTLATVQALASQTVRHARQPTEFLKAFNARLQALGRAHGLLSDREWHDISLDELARREIEPFDTPETPRVKIAGGPVLLSPDQSLGMSMILHELSSNALLHGSLSVSSGTVDLTWHVSGTRKAKRLIIEWRERNGPPVTEPAHHGFGTILIRRSLAKVMESEVRHEFLPSGVVAEISMPLDTDQEG